MSLKSATASVPVLSGLALWGAGFLLAGANFMAVLDTSIANVSVTNIAGSLGASTSQGTWVITSYAVAEAITVPLTGWLAGRFGAVRTFAFAIIGFGIFSALCGFAPTLGSLVFFRVMQGLCGGPLMPLSQTLLVTIFPAKQQPAAMGLWAVTTLVGPIFGPIMGGTLCDTLGWGSIFWVNIPVALLCGPLVLRVLSRHETPTAKVKVDSIGLGLLVVWVGALQVMLDLGKDRDWFASPLIVGLAAAAAIGFVAFLIWELTAANPIVNLKVFRRRGYSVALLTLSLTIGAFFATNVLTPLWLQTNMGYTATWAGYVGGMIGILAIVSAPITSRLLTLVDPRMIVSVAVAWIAGITLMRSGATSQMDFWSIAVWLLFAGAGLPMFFLPLTTMALGDVKPEETASAAGLMSFVRTLSGAVATSIVTTVWENGATRNQADLTGAMGNTQGTLDILTSGGMSAAQAVGNVTQMVQSQAVMLATNQVMFASALIFVAAAAAIWLAPRPTRTVDASAVH